MHTEPREGSYSNEGSHRASGSLVAWVGGEEEGHVLYLGASSNASKKLPLPASARVDFIQVFNVFFISVISF